MYLSGIRSFRSARGRIDAPGVLPLMPQKWQHHICREPKVCVALQTGTFGFPPPLAQTRETDPCQFSRYEGGGELCHETVADGGHVSVRLTHVTETQPHHLPFSHAKLNSTLIIVLHSKFNHSHLTIHNPSNHHHPHHHFLIHFQYSYCDFPTAQQCPVWGRQCLTCRW